MVAGVLLEPLSHHLFTMAVNNGWANTRLLSAIRGLPEARFGAPGVSFFPSIKATYNHIYTVDVYYLDALERHFDGRGVHPHPASFWNPEVPFQTAIELQSAQREVDLRLIALCRARRDTELEERVSVPRVGRVSCDTAVRWLAHLFQHQIHHRGQVHAMLSGPATGPSEGESRFKPPQLDEFFCAGEAHKRADELGMLGLTERDVWSRSQG